MSEVQRFWSHEASNIRCVREADFDRVTAELDQQKRFVEINANSAHGKHKEAMQYRAERDDLQALLTAADDKNDTLTTAYLSAGVREHLLRLRIDVLEGLLREAYEHVPGYLDTPTELWRRIDAALKPAEPTKDEHICTGCGSKGWTANCAECVPY